MLRLEGKRPSAVQTYQRIKHVTLSPRADRLIGHPAHNTCIVSLPSMKDHTYLLKNDLFADADVVIRLATQSGEGADSDADSRASSEPMADASDGDVDNQVLDTAGLIVLTKFPGHLAILCQSEYFFAQAQFLAQSQEHADGKPVLTLTVEDASHLPAVEAVVAVLCSGTDAIGQLSQRQLVHAVQYADMLQMESVVKKAAALLLLAAKAEGGLAADALHALGRLSCHRCLLPVLQVVAGYVNSSNYDSACSCSVQEVLLSVLGNLEAVWTDRELSAMLLELPLLAVKLLLSSDQLQVYSEDTVLYTATRYTAARPDSERPEASAQLSEVIRAQHLSDFQLAAQVINDNNDSKFIMCLHRHWLKQLITFKSLGAVNPDDVRKELPGAPKAWQLPPRHMLHAASDTVVLACRVPVQNIQAAYDACRRDKYHQILLSGNLDDLTAPINGMAWRVVVACVWDDTAQGVHLVCAPVLEWCPEGVFYKYMFSIRGVVGSDMYQAADRITTRADKEGYPDCGSFDIFGLGIMQGHWEESAWAARNLPLEGDIEVALTVYRPTPLSS